MQLSGLQPPRPNESSLGEQLLFMAPKSSRSNGSSGNSKVISVTIPFESWRGYVAEAEQQTLERKSSDATKVTVTSLIAAHGLQLAAKNQQRKEPSKARASTVRAAG